MLDNAERRLYFVAQNSGKFPQNRQFLCPDQFLLALPQRLLRLLEIGDVHKCHDHLLYFSLVIKHRISIYQHPHHIALVRTKYTNRKISQRLLCEHRLINRILLQGQSFAISAEELPVRIHCCLSQHLFFRQPQ